jgi:hypothetical protein
VALFRPAAPRGSGRFDTIEVVGEPRRVYSSFVKGYETLLVWIAG